MVSNKDWKPAGRDAHFDNRKVRFGDNGFDLIWRAVRNHLLYDAQIGNGRSAILMKLINSAKERKVKFSIKLRINKESAV